MTKYELINSWFPMGKDIITAMNTQPGFSIIICAYNAEKRLEKTLRCLAALSIPPGINIELILVDNNSTDRTQEASQIIWNRLKQPFPLNIVKEPNLGLSNARRRGVLAAQYQYGIFCDDDNWLDENYLVHAKSIFDRYTQVGLIGGSSVPVSEVELPSWFYTKCGSYAVGVQANCDGDITWRKFVWGAGMCFLVEPLKLLYLNGIDHLACGRKGSNLTSGEDGEISAWFIFLGYKLYYTSDLKFIHLMPADRLTDNYYKRFFGIHYPSIWTSYSDFLTVRYLLGLDIISKKDLLRFFGMYCSSVIRIISHSHDATKVLAVHRKIHKIRRLLQKKTKLYL